MQQMRVEDALASDSPWYPTMRRLRQKVRGDWEGVMREVAKEWGDAIR